MSIMEWINKILKPISPPSSVQTDPPLELIDLFDPFSELDIHITPNLRWINKPDFILNLSTLPRVPQAYRISIDTTGFAPQTFETSVRESNQLVLTGRDTDKPEEKKREFNKNYILPNQADSEKMVTFMDDSKLVIEMPLKMEELVNSSDLFPTIYPQSDGSKVVEMKFQVPEQFNPAKIDVNLIDRDLIIRAEDSINKPDDVSRFHYYQRTKLPENTAFDELKCIQENITVTCWAPLLSDFKKYFRTIPIEVKEKPLPRATVAQTSSAKANEKLVK